MGFFGLPNNYSVLLHTQIFELCYYGNGFTQEGVYRLPIHLRNFYYKKLVDAKKKENDDVKREDILRAYGELLRDEVIQKIERGRFIVTPDSKYITNPMAKGA